MIPSLNLPILSALSLPVLALPVLALPALTGKPALAFDAVLDRLPDEAPAPFVPNTSGASQAPSISPSNSGLRHIAEQTKPADAAAAVEIDAPIAALLSALGIDQQRPDAAATNDESLSTKPDLPKATEKAQPLPDPQVSAAPYVAAPTAIVAPPAQPIEVTTPTSRTTLATKPEIQTSPEHDRATAVSKDPLRDVTKKAVLAPDEALTQKPIAVIADTPPLAILGLSVNISTTPTPTAPAPSKDYARTVPDTVDRPPPSRKPYEIKPKPIVITLPPEKAEEPAPAIILAVLGVKEAPQIAAPLAPSTPQAAAISAPAVATTDPIRFVVERQLDLARDTRWLDELARDIVSVGERSDRLSFRLMPAQLGRLDVDLSTSDSGLSVRIATTSDAAAQIVTAAQPRLIDELKGQGVRIVGTEVSSGGTQSQGQGQQHQQHHSAEHMIEYARRAFGAIDDTNLTRPSGRFA